MKGFEELDSMWYPSRFGKDDFLGALNYIRPSKVLASLSRPKKGKAYRLSHVLSEDLAFRPTHGAFFYTTSLRSTDYHAPFRPVSNNGLGANIGRMELSDHTGTHIDALNHISINGKLYNGLDASGIIGPRGSSSLGIETTPPVITRGLIVDMPSIRGVDLVEEGPPSQKEIDKFFSENQIIPEEGDAVFFYTGASKLWPDHDRYARLYEKSSGIGMEAARWMVHNRISISGSDSPSSEITPPEVDEAMLPVHQFLITMNGIRLIDNMKLDEIAMDKVYSFLVICAPLPIRGGTGSPVSPIAVV